MEFDNITINPEIAACSYTPAVNTVIKYCCPHCGDSYYMENSRVSTCVYYPPIYKDGVNINPDRNHTTVNCTCLSCGADFNFTR